MNELEHGRDLIGLEKSNLFPVLSEIPELGVELIRLKREVEIQNTLFVFLIDLIKVSLSRGFKVLKFITSALILFCESVFSTSKAVSRPLE